MTDRAPDVFADSSPPRRAAIGAFVALGLPTLLGERAHGAREVAVALGAHELATRRFLDVCVALGVLVRGESGYRCGPAAAERIESMTSPARHERTPASDPWHGEFLAERLRAWRPDGRRPVRRPATPEEEEGDLRAALVAGHALARAIDLSSRSHLLDLGGGSGGMSIALCREHPDLRATLVERAQVAERARATVRESGLAGRIDVRCADFTRDPLPRGDVALLANVLSMLSPETEQALLRKVRGTLAPGGILVVSGWMLDDDGTGPLPALLLSLQDIALGAPDVERSTLEVARGLEEAGYEDVRRGSYLEPLRSVTGRVPRSG